MKPSFPDLSKLNGNFPTSNLSSKKNSKFSNYKVGCIFPMVIWSEFRMGQYWDDDHREDAPQFTFNDMAALVPIFNVCISWICLQLLIATLFDTFLVNVVIADASGSQEYVQMLVRYHIKGWIYLYKYEWAWMFMNFYELRWKWWIREPFLSNRDKSLNR